METGRVDRRKFGSFAVPSHDALVRETRGLMPLPGGGNVAVQRIHSSNLAVSVNRMVCCLYLMTSGIPTMGLFP